MKAILLVLVTLMALAGVVGAGFVAATRTVSSAPVMATGVLPAPAQAQDADLTITLSERFMNEQLAKGMAPSGDVRDVQLDLHAGNRADLTATVYFYVFGARLSVRPRAGLFFSQQNGRIAITVQHVQVGGFGVPSDLIAAEVAQSRQTAEEQLNSQLAQLAANTGLALRSATTDENSVTLVFSR